MSYVIKAPFRTTDNRDHTEVERDLRAQVEALKVKIETLSDLVLLLSNERRHNEY